MAVSRGSLLFTLFLFAIPLCFCDPPAGYRLDWSDEFDGNSLDKGKWEIEVKGGKDTGNDELQYYTDKPTNIFVSGGNLNIRAIPENFQGYGFTSGRLHSTYSTAFGYFEFRAKVPRGKGTWPALWLLPVPARTKYGTWAACGEIDIMETVNDENAVYGTLHFGGQWPKNVQYPPSGQNIYGNIPDRADNFHTYGMLWTDHSIQWFLDGQLKQTATPANWFSMDSNGNRFPAPAPFDQPYNVILNLAVGGAWPCGVGGCPPVASVATLEIDYVRIYKASGNPPPPQPPPERPPQNEQQAGDNCDSCTANSNPNFATGAGFQYYSDECKRQGGIGCIGNSGCRICTTKPQNNPGQKLCPSCVFKFHRI